MILYSRLYIHTILHQIIILVVLLSMDKYTHNKETGTNKVCNQNMYFQHLWTVNFIVELHYYERLATSPVAELVSHSQRHGV